MSSDFLAADKPAGITTHTSLNDADKKKSWVDRADGFMEWLEARHVTKLFPVHRLDKETTGTLLFAKSKEAAEKARELFESREVQKTYLFITDRSTKLGDEFTIESFIERVDNDYVSRTNSASNSKTRFQKLRNHERFTLWAAYPETGKSHQIRLHAQDAGIPLLGDPLHGGAEFPALCLHSKSLEIFGEKFDTPEPVYFTDLSLLTDRRLVRWLAAVDRRERSLRSLSATEREASNTLRWVHTEGDPLRVEQLGEVTHFNWFSDQFPSDAEWSSLNQLAKLKNWSQWYLQLRGNRGKDPHTDHALASDPPPPDRWTARENDLNFEFRRETGLSPGLFLDQRKNRAWLAKQIKPTSRVLNLFCYTGGFSAVAGKAGASQVVSVDVSKTFLDWAKTNFTINDVALEAHEFRAIDSGEYLAWAEKKSLKFDFIICDPPSFARTNTRGKSTVFRIETEFDDLFKRCLRVAAPGAKILFSTNFEQWTLDQFAERALKVIRAEKLTAKLAATPSPDLDFELPRSERHMKALLIEL